MSGLFNKTPLEQIFESGSKNQLAAENAKLKAHVKLLREALNDFLLWANIKDGSPSQYIRDKATEALKQTK